MSRRILTGLLREELGFDGLVVTDALEMRALSAGVGVEEGAVRALAAGADALCVGHDLHEEAVASIVGARRRRGRRRPPHARAARGRSGARRGDRDAGRRRRRPTDAPTRPVGVEAARRALRVRDTPSLDRDPLVVELVPDANIAAGERAYGLADLWPRAIGVRVGETSPDPGRGARRPPRPGRSSSSRATPAATSGNRRARGSCSRSGPRRSSSRRACREA